MLLCSEFLCKFHIIKDKKNPHEEGGMNTSVYCTLERKESYSTPKWFMGRIEMLAFFDIFCPDQPANKQISILNI